MHTIDKLYANDHDLVRRQVMVVEPFVNLALKYWLNRDESKFYKGNNKTKSQYKKLSKS